MVADKLKIPLTAREDREGKKFYVGRIQFPGTLDCKDGLVFLVFTSEDGNEEIQVAGMESTPHDKTHESRLSDRPPRGRDYDR